jgi:hypothetical protein
MGTYASSANSIMIENNSQEFFQTKEVDVNASSAPVAKIVFRVTGDNYQADILPWDYLCSTHPESREIPISAELKK